MVETSEKAARLSCDDGNRQPSPEVVKEETLFGG